MSDRLNQHAGHHTLRGPLHQFQSEATADAVAHEQELLDPEVIHEAKLIVCEGPHGSLAGIGPVDSPPFAFR
jgi:hypothetical protein